MALLVFHRESTGKYMGLEIHFLLFCFKVGFISPSLRHQKNRRMVQYLRERFLSNSEKLSYFSNSFHYREVLTCFSSACVHGADIIVAKDVIKYLDL